MTDRRIDLQGIGVRLGGRVVAGTIVEDNESVMFVRFGPRAS